MKTLVQELIDNDVFTFWSSDWKKKLIVQWGGKTPLKSFKKDIDKLLGKEWGYERRVSAIIEPQKADLIFP